ncbi:MAG: hypothetical protein ACP5N3_05140 [Candidatus Nanoarchaeia archaeon]
MDENKFNKNELRLNKVVNQLSSDDFKMTSIEVNNGCEVIQAFYEASVSEKVFDSPVMYLRERGLGTKSILLREEKNNGILYHHFSLALDRARVHLDIKIYKN